jgi:hypothetical protein
MFKRLSVLVALLILILPTVSIAQAAPAQKKHRPGVLPVRHAAAGTTAGTLTSMNGSVLTLTAAGGVTYTVNVSTTTKIVRLYDGPSALDEMSPGDALLVRGTTVTTGTINATWIKDQSIQRKYTRLVGTIQSVGASSATVIVTRDEHGPTPFHLGQTITLTVGASTKVISPTATGTTLYTGTAGLPILSGDMGGRVTVLGVYDNVQNVFTTVDRITLLKGIKVAVVHEISGTLVSEFGATAPATLTVQTGHYGLVTVTVAASPTVSIVRRYNGRSALDEFTPGDHLVIRGAFADATTYAASSIKDLSIQEAATRAVLKITAVNMSANSFTGTVLRDVNSKRAPFDEGATVTVTVSASTKILVPATAPATGETNGTLSNLLVGQKVTVLGVYNRKQHTYTTTKTVRVHRS